MNKNKAFDIYERHYARMSNVEPDWEFAQQNKKPRES